jgi:hypothetical protein
MRGLDDKVWMNLQIYSPVGLGCGGPAGVLEFFLVDVYRYSGAAEML